MDSETGERRQAYSDELTDPQMEFIFLAKQEREKMKRESAEREMQQNKMKQQF